MSLVDAIRRRRILRTKPSRELPCLVLLLLLIGLAIVDQPSQSQEPVNQIANLDPSVNHSSNLLALLLVDTEETQVAREQLQRRLDTSRVGSIRAAEGEAMQCLIDHHSGHLSSEQIVVSGLIQIGRDVKGLCKAGDLVWTVRLLNRVNISDDLKVGLTNEIWVNARTGETLSLLPR